MKYSIEYASYSDKGNRDINEDALKVCEKEERYGFVLCDGLGGHGMGDIASQLVTDVFVNCFENLYDIPKKFMATTFQAAQDILIAEQVKKAARSQMKTTGVALVIDGKNAYIGHVGDSRLYIFENNTVVKRTMDHSIPQMLALTKSIKESEIRNHPDRNIVLKSFGVDWESPMYEIMKPLALKKCQAFLLCSDGFWELIEEDRMCELLKQSLNPEQWVEKMAKVVKENGAGKNMDNNSAIAVWVNKN